MPVLVDSPSLLASATHSRNHGEAKSDGASRASEQGSHSSAQGSRTDLEGSKSAIMRTALEELNVAVPHYTELQACWRDTRVSYRLSTDGRTLAAVHDATHLEVLVEGFLTHCTL